ncbi:hypothetical protein LAZ67_9003311 [Cordylochernes scorpioides]|uniref:RING-type domain-containing protein n=1 Tax=Cordylochernes scorpioides TaxID=51811 RepID=A0ABY6KUC9_9ARAC|nr:hypothetical protein LAZ67_9003311 [Cordylochernes scorpioides]
MENVGARCRYWLPGSNQGGTCFPAKWMMGRVVEVHRGKDGLVQVVSIRTRTGILTLVKPTCSPPFSLMVPINSGRMLNCTICLDTISQEDLCFPLNCPKYRFHLECLKTWCKQTIICPICRHEFTDIICNVSSPEYYDIMAVNSFNPTEMVNEEVPFFYDVIDEEEDYDYMDEEPYILNLSEDESYDMFDDSF